MERFVRPDGAGRRGGRLAWSRLSVVAGGLRRAFHVRLDGWRRRAGAVLPVRRLDAGPDIVTTTSDT